MNAVKYCESIMCPVVSYRCEGDVEDSTVAVQPTFTVDYPTLPFDLSQFVGRVACGEWVLDRIVGETPLDHRFKAVVSMSIKNDPVEFTRQRDEIILSSRG